MRLDPRQDAVAEGAHLCDDVVGPGSLEIEVDRGDAEFAQGADVRNEVGVAAGKQAAVAVRGGGRNGIAIALDAVGQRNGVRVAPRRGGQLTQPRDAGLIARKVSRRCALLLPMGYQASPKRAARRSDGPLSPPTQIGGCGLCAGFGSSTSRS